LYQKLAPHTAPPPCTVARSAPLFESQRLVFLRRNRRVFVVIQIPFDFIVVGGPAGVQEAGFEGLLLFRDRRCLSSLNRPGGSSPTRPRDATRQARRKRASDLLAANHIEVLCVYRSGSVCQESCDAGLYLARPRKRSCRRCVHGTQEEGKETARKVLHTNIDLLPLGTRRRKQDEHIEGNGAKDLHMMNHRRTVCDVGRIRLTLVLKRAT
jgi:hypothetical protein